MTGHSLKNGLHKVIRASYQFMGLLVKSIGLNVDTPVFIIGTGRCGTTLLVNILESHPEVICYPDEANNLWHPKMYPFKNAQVKIHPIEFAPKDFTQKSIENWPQDHKKTIYNTFNGFHYICGYKKTMLVKSAMISFMIPKILEIYPDARFIHIFRSGPSVVASYLKRNLAKYPEAIGDKDEYRLLCARYWNDCIQEIERVRTECRLDERKAYFELSYEELCNEPAEIMKKVSAYLEVKDDLFAYNFTQVKSTNYKVKNSEKGILWADCVRVMEPSMLKKGYSTGL